MRRVSVVGNAGSGKTTTARALAAALGVPAVELDALYHGPGWTEPEPRDFRAAVAERCAHAGWVVDGNYSLVRDLVWERADTVVFLDFSRPVITRRIVWRSLRRVVTREELWNGNRERLANLLTADPTESIIRWSVTQHEKYRARYHAALDDPRWKHLRFVWLRDPAATRAWIRAMAAGDSTR